MGTVSLTAAAAVEDPNIFILPPLPNTLFTRDSSCWIYNSVSINPVYWLARRREAYNVTTIYRAHPMFQDADFEYWYPPLGDDGRFQAADFGRSSMEGGDVMPACCFWASCSVSRGSGGSHRHIPPM